MKGYRHTPLQTYLFKPITSRLDNRGFTFCTPATINILCSFDNMALRTGFIKGHVCRTLTVLPLLFAFFTAPGAQQNPADSLARVFPILKGKEHEHDSTRINLLLTTGKDRVYQLPDSALLYFKTCITLADAAGLPVLKAQSMDWAGVAHYVLGEYTEALPYFQDALAINEALKNHYGISTSLNHIGLIFESQEQHEKAIQYHLKAVKHASIINNKDRIASNYFNIALVHDVTGQYDSALYYLNLSLTLSREVNAHRLVAMNYNRLGEVNFHQKNYTTAEQYYKQALAYREHQSNWENCFAWAGLAQTYSATRHYKQGIEAGLKAYKLAQTMDAKWEIIRIAKILAEAYAGQKSFDEAYRMSTLAQQYSDSVFNEYKERELNLLHLKQSELQQVKLKQQNEAQQNEIRIKNFAIILITLSGVSILVIAAILYSRHQQKLKLNRELNIINEKIELQNKELNKLNQTKNNLLSIIGHDLRSPFVNLYALLELVKDGNLDSETQKRLFGNLQTSVRTVSGTLDSLLQWASSQMEGLQVDPVTINLDEVVESQIQFSKLSADRKGISIRHETGNFTAWADLEQLKTVIRNILGNAIKFTAASGIVTISYRQNSSLVGITITDTGIGMDESTRNTLFTYTGKNKTTGTDNEKGTGLGLMICKQFIESNGGHIEVQSEAGRGSAFTIWLPFKK